MTRVSVIVPNWNGGPHLRVCLEALSRQTYRDFETIVVDNASTDGSVTYLRDERPDVRVLKLDENVGFPAAANRGIRASESEFVVLLNNDTHAEPEWLERLVAAMSEHRTFSYGSSKLVRFDQSEVVDSVGHAYSLWRGAAINMGQGEPASRYRGQSWVFGASAAASIYRRSMFDDIGLFDEDFFLTHEDVELDLRANVAGHRCLSITDAVVQHHRGKSYEVTPALHLMGVRNRIWAAGSNLPPALFALWFTMEIVRTVWMLPARRLGWLRSDPERSTWPEVSVAQFVRSVLGALRALPRKRADRKAIRRMHSLPLLRSIWTTRTGHHIDQRTRMASVRGS